MYLRSSGKIASRGRVTNKETNEPTGVASPVSAATASTPGERGPGDSRQKAGSRAIARLQVLVARHERAFFVCCLVLLVILSLLVYDALQPDQPVYTQDDIDAAVSFALDERADDPPVTTMAARAIAPSVVRVRRLNANPSIEQEEGIGTGVVIENTGVILTNFHVVAGAERVGIVFADGFETEATVTGVQPDNDLAVLQAEVIPEGLLPATLAGSGTLSPGDQVVAVGHPFGIGPSVSSGVVSGLGRRYFARGTENVLENLIQFDAAANPGNSGGPLVNRRGEVVGIVTSILNPTDEAFFVGIGFAVPIETAAQAAGPNPF
jgi:S1-C subfamily serine protease